MKKYIYIIFGLTILVQSCIQNNNVFEFNNTTGTHFVRATSSVSEASLEPVGIVVVITSAQGIESGNVNFQIEGLEPNTIEGSSFMILNSTNVLDFSTGISDTIWILPIDNEAVDGAKTVQITLTSGSLNAGLPGENANLSVHLLTINDDDCALEINNFVQAYKVCELGYDVFDFATVSLDVTRNNVLVVENLGDWGGNDAFLIFDPDVANSSIEIEQTFTGYGFDCDGDGATDPLFWSGSGQYIACTKEFQVTYFFICADGTPLATGTDIFTISGNDNCDPLF